MAHKRLSTYLNDHFAGSTAGLELARRAAGANKDTAYGPILSEIAKEIDEDRAVLIDVMERLSVPSDRVKQAAAWTAEKAGRLKLNGQLLGYSPQSRVTELEGLSLGVEGKRSLWIALREVMADDPRLKGVDLNSLIDRAESQRKRLEEHRLRALAESLGPEVRAG